jgi:hypothetical protein
MPPAPLALDTTTTGNTPPALPAGFDIRVFADPAEANAPARFMLTTEVDIPEGSYVISALSDRDFLGKFQVHWTDSLIQATGTLTEAPLSMTGWEPFGRVFTPTLNTNTVIRQVWETPGGTGPFEGEVFFVLEPQCVPYALKFSVEKEPMGWSTTYGEVAPSYPD